MDKIGGSPEEKKPKTLGEAIERTNAAKKKVTRSILNNTGIFIGIFIIFVVIVVFTTDIKLTSAAEWAALGLSFFVLLFCSYSMYLNASDSGAKAGRQSDTYKESNTHYDTLKKDIINNKMQGRLSEFCRYYIEEELQNARNAILTEVGVDYDVYQGEYIGKDKRDLEKLENLSKAQIEAILKANKINPIKLTPEMILKRGRGSHRRNPLEMKPETKRGIKYVVKFIHTCILSVITAVIVLDVVVNPTWATFAACCLKLFPVILNWFMGYKMGYENIVIDTVNYMNDQADLMQRLKNYVEQYPKPRPLISEKQAETPPVTEETPAETEEKKPSE